MAFRIFMQRKPQRSPAETAGRKPERRLQDGPLRLAFAPEPPAIVRQVRAEERGGEVVARGELANWFDFTARFARFPGGPARGVDLKGARGQYAIEWPEGRISRKGAAALRRRIAEVLQKIGARRKPDPLSGFFDAMSGEGVDDSLPAGTTFGGG